MHLSGGNKFIARQEPETDEKVVIGGTMNLRRAVSNESNKIDQIRARDMAHGLKIVTAFAKTLIFVSQNPCGV